MDVTSANLCRTKRKIGKIMVRMSKDKEWASHIELTAIADCLGVPVLITNDADDVENFQIWIYPSTAKTTSVILLGFCINHYYSLEGM